MISYFYQDSLDRLHPMLWADDEHGQALAKYMESVAEMFDIMSYIIRDDRVTGAVGWSNLINGEKCPDSLLVWLAQLAGVMPVNGERPDQLRQRILHNEAFSRGTVQSLYDAAARYGATLVLVEERYDASGTDRPWHVKVLFTDDQYTDAGLQAVRDALPAGITLEDGRWAGRLYQDVKDDTPTYAVVKSTYATYRDMRGG